METMLSKSPYRPSRPYGRTPLPLAPSLGPAPRAKHRRLWQETRSARPRWSQSLPSPLALLGEEALREVHPFLQLAEPPLLVLEPFTYLRYFGVRVSTRWRPLGPCSQQKPPRLG